MNKINDFMLLLSVCLLTAQVFSAIDTENHTQQTNDNPKKYTAVRVTRSDDKATLSEDEWKLYKLIMAHRKSRGLREIPLSNSLTIVAQAHCWDLQDNPRVITKRCNLHSWSNKGDWSACCYTSDHKQANCMWNKPRELTDYPGDGFEISHGAYNANVTPQSAFNGWKSSAGHNDVMINRGMWRDNEWQAIGIGMSDGFAMVWFGMEPDPAGSPAKPSK